MALKRITWLRGASTYIAPGTFSSIRCGTSQTPPHADTMSSLCPMGLWDQTNEHPNKPHTEVEDRL